VAEALRRECGVHLVHVARPAFRASCSLDDVALVEGELRRAGEAILADAARRTEHLLLEGAKGDEPLSVSTELTHGSVVASLDSLSEHAGLVVLQHHGMGPTGETPTLSVTAGVATRAQCPVVAVPAAWRPMPPKGVVAVGVDVAARSVPVVAAALHEAARRIARLRVVHGWQLDPEASGTADQQQSLLRRRVADLVTEARRDAPDVDVELALEPGPAGEVLREHSGHADVVVVGRHHRRHVVGARLGRTVHEILRWSEVPVIVVDPTRGDVLTRLDRRTSTSSGTGPAVVP
jgi:nucleotide-binding universal stress UspA family protein